MSGITDKSHFFCKMSNQIKQSHFLVIHSYLKKLSVKQGSKPFRKELAASLTLQMKGLGGIIECRIIKDIFPEPCSLNSRIPELNWVEDTLLTLLYMICKLWLVTKQIKKQTNCSTLHKTDIHSFLCVCFGHRALQ